eukprot:gene8403-biopygen10645
MNGSRRGRMSQREPLSLLGLALESVAFGVNPYFHVGIGRWGSESAGCGSGNAGATLNWVPPPYAPAAPAPSPWPVAARTGAAPLYALHAAGARRAVALAQRVGLNRGKGWSATPQLGGMRRGAKTQVFPPHTGGPPPRFMSPRTDGIMSSRMVNVPMRTARTLLQARASRPLAGEARRTMGARPRGYELPVISVAVAALAREIRPSNRPNEHRHQRP